MGLVEGVGRRVGGSCVGCCARCRFRRAGVEDEGGGFGFSGASFRGVGEVTGGVSAEGGGYLGWLMGDLSLRRGPSRAALVGCRRGSHLNNYTRYGIGKGKFLHWYGYPLL